MKGQNDNTVDCVSFDVFNSQKLVKNVCVCVCVCVCV